MQKNDPFDSSDSCRNAQPLPYAQSVTFDDPVILENGSELSRVTVVYETYGKLNAQRTNAVLICHALTGDSHVAQHADDDSPGWWELMVGSGKCIDTDRYFVVCPNILGGCRGTTGPNSVNPATGKPYGADFPVITVLDMVRVQRRLLDHLGIQRLLAVVGGSLGGHMVLHWATHFPEMVAGAVALATSPRMTSQALAFDIVGRNAILRDPDYQGGEYYANGHGPAVGLALARMLGHITYLSREAMTQKFEAQRLRPHEVRTQFETKFSVGSYLAYQGDKFVERFDPNSYLTITMALDLLDLGDTREKLMETFRPAKCRWLLLSFTSDWLFPPFQSQQMVDALIALNKPVTYCDVRSKGGHDSFLLRDELHVYGEMIRAFLDDLSTDESPADEEENAAEGDTADLNPRSIFYTHRRLDYESILARIPPGASVLDLGCGTGGLLARLKRRGYQRIMGVENDEHAILACVRRGLDVIHANLNEGLPGFADDQFDYVVLSQTLQAVVDVEKVLADMLRVGRRGIVSFPNFAYWKLRQQLSEQGRAPRAQALRFQWYNTPNVRFLTLADFLDFCRERKICIHEQLALDTESDQQVYDDPNLNADVAIFVISR
jgi:homoserine O-acetyltransferase